VYYVVTVDHNGMTAHFTRSDCGRSAVHSVQWMGLMMIYCSCCFVTYRSQYSYRYNYSLLTREKQVCDALLNTSAS